RLLWLSDWGGFLSDEILCRGVFHQLRAQRYLWLGSAANFAAIRTAAGRVGAVPHFQREWPAFRGGQLLHPQRCRPRKLRPVGSESTQACKLRGFGGRVSIKLIHASA